MNINTDEFVWVQKYRPSTINEIILTDSLKKIFNGIVKEGKCPNLLLSGTSGVGKTTVAYALAKELNADLMYINASSESSIDVIRTKVLQFASTISFSGGSKITLLDEFDGMSPNAMNALKGFLEEFSSNHSFIFTSNSLHKIIEPLQSRCQVIDFGVSNADKAKLAAQFFKRVTQILEYEKIEYEKPIVAEIVQEFFPDFRKCLNALQKYSQSGKIDSGILSSFSSDNFNVLIKSLKDKKFTDMRRWLVQNNDIDPNKLFREFYDTASDKMEAKSIPALILHLGEYQYKSAFSLDQEINTAAFLTEVMTDPMIVWK